ncbi:hypothetical protein [Rheinheimera sp. NSM]|uniref:hypothetical protein n=1 Tax=Rheinheimera sp. NSM TaxID=3457884 RepID=UPI0040359DC8
MNPIEEQKSIISQLCEIMHLSVDGEYEVMNCRFDYSKSKDGSSSLGAEFWYELHGHSVSKALVYPERKKLSKLIPELHSLMNKHTGGNWSCFVISIDEKGKATTKFEYSL